jgi:esterase/lipase
MKQGRIIPEFPMLALDFRHQPSGLNSNFCYGQLSFADYEAACRKMLRLAHSGKSPGDLEKAVAGNAPFELRPEGNFQAGNEKPYRRGILLIHGLTDSPYFMRPLAEFFRQQGFRVMAVLLPGHGTQPGDLLDIHWQEWAQAVDYGAARLADEAEEVYLAGYSAGATLAVRHSLLDSRVRGAFLYSPALSVSKLAAWASLHKIYSWLKPSAKWVNIQPDADIYKYESFPKNAAFQMHALIADLRARMRGRGLNIPVFAAASADDATVDSSATVEFMARACHPCTKLVFYTTNVAQHLPGIAESRVEMVSSVVPEQNIVSYSHLSILLPPENPHYGMVGEYSNCLHYLPDDLEKFSICRSHPHALLQGETTENNLRTGVMRRLTYNPHFSDLIASMQKFIGNLP